MDKDALPPQITPGLSLYRQWYLYQQIRQFCDEEFQDTTCPEPERQKRSHTQDEDESRLVKRSKRRCSYCRMADHTKTKKGVVTCPKLLQESAKRLTRTIASYFQMCLLVLLELCMYCFFYLL